MKTGSYTGAGSSTTEVRDHRSRYSLDGIDSFDKYVNEQEGSCGMVASKYFRQGQASHLCWDYTRRDQGTAFFEICLVMF